MVLYVCTGARIVILSSEVETVDNTFFKGWVVVVVVGGHSVS